MLFPESHFDRTELIEAERALATALTILEEPMLAAAETGHVDADMTDYVLNAMNLALQQLQIQIAYAAREDNHA